MSKFWSSGSNSSSSTSESENDDGNEENDWSETNESDVVSRDSLSQDPDLAWDAIKEKQEFMEPLQSSNKKPPNSTRIVCMSDTHGKHREIHLPAGDLLIHGGDFTKSGEPGNIRDLDRFFGEAHFEEIICIAGNHDMTMHPEFYDRNWERFHKQKFQSSKTRFDNCTYLEDASCTTRNGLDVYGSPWSPVFFDWAFNLDRGAPIREMWDKIPDTTDLLITHGPPLGRGDLTNEKIRAGCYDLLIAVQERVKPRLHIFGHIHEGAGVSFDGNVLYVNASNLNIKYQAVNYPVVIDLPHDVSQPAMIAPPNCTLKSTDLLGWCGDNGFLSIAQLLETANLESVPSGNDLLEPNAFEKICGSLDIFRDRDALKELRTMQAKLYAQSFPHNT
mmetsp:Transcript_132340/g.197196  ORF Transcript_132340/g.197196 Transcript_132340/m.197196 type:complete len:389 (+) Transcript_132340:122-1288(+)